MGEGRGGFTCPSGRVRPRNEDRLPPRNLTYNFRHQRQKNLEASGEKKEVNKPVQRSGMRGALDCSSGNNQKTMNRAVRILR